MCRTHHSLQITLRVPVRVVDDDNVSSGQVDTQTSGPCGQHEDEFLAVWGIILQDGFLKKKGIQFNVHNFSKGKAAKLAERRDAERLKRHLFYIKTPKNFQAYLLKIKRGVPLQ